MSKIHFEEHMVFSLIKFWEKLVTHHYTMKKQSTISTTWKLFQLIFRMCKSVCIDVPIINNECRTVLVKNLIKENFYEKRKKKQLIF